MHNAVNNNNKKLFFYSLQKYVRILVNNHNKLAINIHNSKLVNSRNMIRILYKPKIHF